MIDQDFSSRITELRDTYSNIRSVVGVERLQQEVEELSAQAGEPDLWDDTEKAQKVTSDLSHRQSETRPDRRAAAPPRRPRRARRDGQGRRGVRRGGGRRGSTASPRSWTSLEVQTLLNGEFDPRPAVVTIRAGAGGVDAADFAEMLMRMYLRWAEQHDYSATVLDTSYAEEAGIKSATFEIDAPYAFGTLSVEAGTHRLVRMSPFNSAGKRQTSFAAVEVVPLIEQTESIEIPENDMRVDVFRSSGPGGQSVNTTDSAVRITHLPTGIVVTCQNEKSQIQNRAAALRVLQSRLLLVQREQEAATKKEPRRQHHGELGRPDAQLRARAVPDGQGPPHGARGQQPVERVRRRPRRLHLRGHPLAQVARPRLRESGDRPPR
ncbi:PCRF domain-containing protein [Clavibacter tessellarius]